MPRWFLLLVLVAILPARAAEEASSLASAKAEFQKQDQALNVVYAALKKDLPEHRFALLREDQRKWVEHRNYLAGWQAELEKVKPADSAAYWETAAAMTEERIEYLQGWRGIGEEGTWTGTYRDGQGGLLQLVQRKEGLFFTLDVVRGPTFHTGVIGGQGKVNHNMARADVPGDEGEGPCWVSFLNNRQGDGRIEVITANAERFHGARAYFDATYLRVGLLDEAAQARVVAAAKEGGKAE